jgi:hypothetical protein
MRIVKCKVSVGRLDIIQRSYLNPKHMTNIYIRDNLIQYLILKLILYFSIFDEMKREIK